MDVSSLSWKPCVCVCVCVSVCVCVCVCEPMTDTKTREILQFFHQVWKRLNFKRWANTHHKIQSIFTKLLPDFFAVISFRDWQLPGGTEWTSKACFEEKFVSHFHYHNSRVSDQNGVPQIWYIVEIYHSGRKPSIYFTWRTLRHTCWSAEHRSPEYIRHIHVLM